MLTGLKEGKYGPEHHWKKKIKNKSDGLETIC